MDPKSIPSKVLGAAITDSGSILLANSDSTALNVFNGDGTDSGDDIALTLDGEPFTLRNGDLASGCNTPNNDEEEECLNYEVFYSDIPLGSGPTSIYKVNFVGGDADLALIREFDGNANYHIAYNHDVNVIYAVNENGSGFETVDPILGTSTFTAFPESTSKTTTAVYYQGDLYVGSAQLDKVYVYDLMTGTLTFIADAPVAGGDLVVVDEQLFLASQNAGNTWYKISGGTATAVVAIPGGGKVNGATLLDNGSIMFSNKDLNAFQVLNADSSVDEVPVYLDGELFTLRWGDLASGCNVPNNEEQCSPDIVNGDFEILEEGYSISGGWDYVPENEVPGWKASLDGTGIIEIQESGAVDGNESFSGDHHYELNGDALNSLYQVVCSEPGTNLKVSFAHKKRRPSGDDILELYMGGDINTIEDNDAAKYMLLDDEDGWVIQEFVYEVPAGQFETVIYFKAMDGTNNTVGNLMDDVKIGLTVEAATDISALDATLSEKQQIYNSQAHVDMYPVPASDRLNVRLSTPTAMTVSYEIVNVMGQSFNRGSVDTYSGQTEITADVSNLSEGAYFFVMEMNGNTVTKQFVKAGR